MNDARQTANEQFALWNGYAGRAWVDTQATLDRLFEPIQTMLVEAVRNASAHSVLDVGCGTGATTLAIARMLGTHGRSLGVDLSEPMIAAARTRAEQENLPVAFVCADAQTHAFEPASADMIVSRFGVMFFADPVAAFTNLRSAARDGAALHAIVWRSAAENPFMTTAERAAAPLLPNLPPRRAEGPGQFAFADRARVSSILEKSRWTHVEMRPIDVPCTVPADAIAGYASRLGPVGAALQEVDEPTRERVLKTVSAAFGEYLHGGELRFDAACWAVTARAG
ncbi:class I SAM-dependent methyltransferase [Trinickia caryophylli]|uniref:Methyltransferase domain-containing protein n=1 Tax=Trinickia caryophylli TaxID=28094 RepID=A0A1X7FJL0_TRICW|nr:class I SAM-dependent methyltransferase [Trinickia caryophylli]PMS13183.1 class I SAM-dependent methyltransferase [Trinickia caryophylli]TRX19291.1 class I SAM-dependent methyltransferase [Trinickia caryophylli]WQE13406.1 class I SAM-dependent methyltransferase [Trinickia caryophylli]SMF53320.1 Methyltransferase domain-containing protein [Trinickia caryophylli]GLU34072.1 hypothetical protein Busp01_39140 [Trinickia caryophylli]